MSVRHTSLVHPTKERRIEVLFEVEAGFLVLHSGKRIVLAPRREQDRRARDEREGVAILPEDDLAAGGCVVADGGDGTESVEDVELVLDRRACRITEAPFGSAEDRMFEGGVDAAVFEAVEFRHLVGKQVGSKLAVEICKDGSDNSCNDWMALTVLICRDQLEGIAAKELIHLTAIGAHILDDELPENVR